MNDEATSQSRGPTGLGGWLILVAFGLVGHVINNVIDINDTYLPMFRDGTWETLTTLLHSIGMRFNGYQSGAGP